MFNIPKALFGRAQNITRAAVCLGLGLGAWLIILSIRNTVSSATPQRDVGRQLRFSEHLISKDYTYAYGIGAADLDGDGDIDLTSSDCATNGSVDHDSLYWFENDGATKFQRHFLYNVSKPGRMERHRIGDINKDGRPDVVIVNNFYGDVYWFENPGKAAIREPWKQHYVTHGGLLGAYDVDLADFDKDGDLDIAASSWRMGNQFVWFENPGKKADGEWTEHLIDSGIFETRNVRAADFDGDGDSDLLCTASESGILLWYENPGPRSTATWRRHVIDTIARPIHGEPVDMDGDGDLDVVMAVGMGMREAKGQVLWYENMRKQGDLNWWKKHVIQDDFKNAIETVAGDIDGDRDVDVVATAWGPEGKVAWFENPGNPQDSWRMHLLKENWPRANQPILVDLDRDGKLDIVAVAEVGGLELRWWRNEGSVAE